ncbi:MAG TPA: hypothetical protein VG826_20095 [Pirellulales bacterium]|nr:hypothetical protein [Pirellulales bacterium]
MGAVCVFHDTSPLRQGIDSSFEYIRYTESACNPASTCTSGIWR